ncbi:MAG: hypothetical protein HQ582_33880, partial [Planctomycetes bacterium]|nr:hypothetical protein [Planctomycetota bacterium]
VDGMLGSAGEERLACLVGHLVDRDAAQALTELDAAVHEGVDVAQLVEQLFGYFRDSMAAVVGCPPETFLYASPRGKDGVVSTGQRLGLETVLAVMQILDQTLSRLRQSTQGRILTELALVRIASLDDLDELGALIARLQEGGPPQVSGQGPGRGPGVARAPSEPQRTTDSAPPKEDSAATTGGSPEATSAEPPAAKVVLTAENAREVWSHALSRVSGLGARHAKDYAEIATLAPDRLVIRFKRAYTLSKSICERPDQMAKFQQALAELTGQSIQVQFALLEEGDAEDAHRSAPRTVSPQQRIMEVSGHPMIRRAGELFDAKPIRVDDPPEKGQ